MSGWRFQPTPEPAAPDVVRAFGPRARAGRRGGAKPGSEAAKRGGLAVRDRLGPEFYREIAYKGGAAVKQRHGPDFFREIGSKGGTATRNLRGREYYERLGQRAGIASGQSRNRKRRPPMAAG